MKNFPSPKQLKRKILLKGKGKLKNVLGVDPDEIESNNNYY